MTNQSSLETQALDILEKTFALRLDEREAYILMQTSHDENLKDRVMRMYNADIQQANLPSTGSGLNFTDRILSPSRIGTFDIIDELGSGGMGSVYLGRKISDDFEFYAAIKIVRRDTLSDDMIVRLKTERRTLANLRHPNIAHFYDGGEDENGNPFFAMEYVKGDKLYDYVKNVETPIEKRLSIFKDTCSAVAFAHQNLVIHRDLTPANIIVADDGVTKLIDFGIAHTLNDDNHLPTKPDKTGTQGYIAPERNRGQSASTITDIYSLGVILKDLIDKGDFPRKTDLIAIANKASNNTPAHRYQSVDALMQDLQRFEKGQAVSAIEQNWSYLLKRFVGSNRLLVSAVTSVFIVSLLASLVISLSYVRIEAAEENSRNRFNEVRNLANFMMFDLYDEIVKLDTSLAAREILIETSLDYLDGLSVFPEAPQDLQVEIALGYQRMADIAGGTASINLGNRTKADNLYIEAKRQIKAAYVLNPHDPKTIRAYAEIYRKMGTFEWISNLNFPEAARHFSLAKSALKNLLDKPTASIDDYVMDGALALGLSQSARNISDFDNAIAWSKNGIDILSDLHKRYPHHYEAQFNLAHAYIYLGEAITTQVFELGGDIHKAIEPFDKGKYHLKELISQENAPTLAKAQYITALYKRSVATCQLDETREDALADLIVAEQISEALMAEEPNNNFVDERLLSTLATHADCELRDGNFLQALKIANRLNDRRQHKLKDAPDNPFNIANTIYSQLLVANILQSMNELDDACEFLKQGRDNINNLNKVAKSPPTFHLQASIEEIKQGNHKCEQAH